MTERSRNSPVARAASFPVWAWRNRPELWVLGGIFLAGLLFLAFVQIADEVAEGETTKFDQAILLALRNSADTAEPLGPPWVEEMARDITALGSTAVLGIMFFAVIAYLLLMKQRAAALWVAIAVIGGLLVSNGLKTAFARPRPELVSHLVRVTSFSFPSGHAMLSAVTYLTLGALLASLHSSRRLKLFFLGLAIVITIAVGVSRVYLGVHYPTDVLAGWCVGAAWASICWMVFHWLQRRGTIEPAARDALGEGDEANGR